MWLLEFLAGIFYNKLSKRVKFLNSFKFLFAILVVVVGILLYRDGWRPKFIMEENRRGIFVERIIAGVSKIAEVASSAVPDKPEIKQLPMDCNAGYICSDFREEDFSGWSDYSKSQRNPRSLIVSSDSSFDNPPLIFKNSSTGFNFQMIVKAVPLDSRKGNIVLFYKDIWRCTIAESNYNAVICQNKYNSLQPIPRQKPQFLSSKGKKPISPDNEILITLISSLTAEGNNRINISLEYVDTGSKQEKADFTYEFGIPTSDIKGFKQFVGVGIIDSKNEKIEVEFKNFKLLVM